MSTSLLEFLVWLRIMLHAIGIRACRRLLPLARSRSDEVRPVLASLSSIQVAPSRAEGARSKGGATRNSAAAVVCLVLSALGRWPSSNTGVDYCTDRQAEKAALKSSKRHRKLVRTGLTACVAYLIRKGAGRRATDFIGEETVVPGRNDQRAVAVNIDLTRSRAAPRQVRSPFPTY